jgi:hypothetical protein
MKKYDFDEVVKVVSTAKSLEKINGKFGVVVGVAQSEENPDYFTYGICFYDDNGELGNVWRVPEKDLEPTGKKIDPESHQSTTRVRVKVDPKTGEGIIIEYDEE